MAYHLEMLDDSSILFTIIGADFEMKTDLPPYATELRAYLDAAPEPIYLLSDTREYKPGFGEMVQGLGAFSKGSSSAIFGHPNIAEVCVVTHSDVLRLATNALNQAQYGHMESSAFDNVDDALNYIRDKIGQAPT